jgi:pimeloyl-ACP methyl ester carboxylesterase
MRMPVIVLAALLGLVAVTPPLAAQDAPAGEYRLGFWIGFGPGHPRPTEPSVLRQVTAPVLILQGSQSHATWPWFIESVRHIAGHLPDASVREVAGAGDMGAWVEPAAVSEELIRFFEERLAAVRREGEQPAAR